MTLQTLTNGTSLIVLCIFKHRIYFCRRLTVYLSIIGPFYLPNDHSPETGALIVAVYWVDRRSYHSRVRVHCTPNGFLAAGITHGRSAVKWIERVAFLLLQYRNLLTNLLTEWMSLVNSQFQIVNSTWSKDTVAQQLLTVGLNFTS